MITRDELTKAVAEIIGNDLLTKANSVDHRANGVQILGKDKVNKVCLGVTCNLEFLTEAVDSGAEYCIFHHGLDLDGSDIYNSRLNISQQKQLQAVFESELTIAGYHYSLDTQPEFGNASYIIRELGAKRLEIPYMSGWGWVGEFSNEQDVKDLAKRCGALFSHDIFAVYGGPKEVKRVGVATGGAKAVGIYLHEIEEQNIDLHITGEINHTGIDMAKECDFNYFAGGHYATEVFGVQELGKKLKKKFGNKLEVEFIDIPNPL